MIRSEWVGRLCNVIMIKQDEAAVPKVPTMPTTLGFLRLNKLAVQSRHSLNSSICDNVRRAPDTTNNQTFHNITERPRTLWHLRNIIRLLEDMTCPIKKTNTKKMTKTFRNHLQRAIFDNCDQEYVKCEWRVTDPSQMLLAFFWKLPHIANPYRSGHGRCDWPSGSKEGPLEVLIITEGKLEKDWGL